jgi:hypothetical protein
MARMPKDPAKAPKRPRKSKPAVNAHSLGYRGSETFGRVFVDAFHGIDEEAAAIGFPGLRSNEVREWMGDFPVESQADRGPTMIAGHVIFFIKVVAYLKEPVTKALVEVASGEFFKLVFVRLAKVFKKDPAPTETIQYPVLFKPSMFFQAENVMVTAIMTISKPEDYKDAERLVPLAFERAVDWLARNGRQEPYLTYRIKDGQLNSFPTISAEPINS